MTILLTAHGAVASRIQPAQNAGYRSADCWAKKPESYRNYWVKEKLPLIGLPDPTHSVMNLYRQEMKIHKLGRMPAQTLIDKNEILKFVYYGNTMADIPDINQIQKTLEA